MSSIISAIIGYIIIVSTLYLMGYWAEFGVNYWEYITISEVSVVALNSIVYSFGFVVLSSLLSYIYLDKYFKVGEGRGSRQGKFMNKWWKFIALPFVIASVYGVYADRPLAIFGLALIFTPIIGIWIANQGALENIIKNPDIRFVAITMAIGVIFLSHPKGFLDAYSRKNNSGSHQVVIENTQYTYLGKLNESLFLYQKSSENVIQLTPIPKEIKYIPSEKN